MIKGIMKKFWLLILINATAMSCSEDPQVTPATYSLLLTGEQSKTWIQVAQTYTLADERFGDPEIDLFEGSPPCAKDDLYRFIRETKSLEITEGASKCDPDDPDLIATTNWDIVNATTSIFIGSNNRFDLITLSEESLIYGRQDTLSFFIGEDETATLPGFWQFEYVPTAEN